MSPSPIIKGRPNLAPNAFPEVERYRDPIEAGYADSLIVFDLVSYPCNKMNLKNKKLHPDQKKRFHDAVDKLSKYTWYQSKHSSDTTKYRWIPATDLNNVSPPQAVKEKGIPYYICFKYNGQKNIFGGFFDKGIHYVIWIGQAATDVYVH